MKTSVEEDSRRESLSDSHSFKDTQVNINIMHEKTVALANNLVKELAHMKDITDHCSSKSHWRDTYTALSEATATLLLEGQLMQEKLKVVSIAVKVQREKMNAALQSSEGAFSACLKDNNKLRAKFGLDLVSSSKFVNSAEASSEKAMSISRTNRSLSRTDDVFFDAEEGEISTSSSNYSMHDAEEKIEIDEDSDEASRASSTMLLNTSKVVVRRKNLPCPAGSMENISIMGILRNNVSRKLIIGW